MTGSRSAAALTSEGGNHGPAFPPRLGAAARHGTRVALVGTALVGTMLFVPTLVVAQCNAPVDRGDADGNGMVNHFEINVGTNPCDPDTDHDGLNDSQEVVIHGTNPFSPDTDGDGLGDVYELNTGSNPLVNGNAPTPAPAPVGPAPAERPDADGDGLYDDDEWNVYGTDAGAYDTDGDGSGDGEEVYYGSGPLDPFCDPYGCG